MKNIIILIAAFLIVVTSSAQDITGQWNGILKEINLRLVLHISETDAGYSSTMDSPDQGATGIPVTSTTFEDSTLTISVTNLGLTYTAKFADDNFDGTFNQGGMVLPLKMSREAVEKPEVKRPQHPKEPYPYHSEEVTFKNEKADLTLAGTLTLPKQEGTFPAVILISGSGPQDRNEELAGHKPFLVIADHFTKNGIAVLRYDDRGFGKSTGSFETSIMPDFVTDVESAIAYLKTREEIDPKEIGLVGHSEGGFIAPMVAARSKDVNFIVLLAGAGIRGDKIVLLQQELIARASGNSEEDIQTTQELNTEVFKMILASDDIETLKKDLTDYLTTAFNNDPKQLVPEGITAENFTATQVDILATPWLVFFLGHDPAPVLEKVSCPVLALNGEKDLQVPPLENLKAIENALKKGGNEKVLIKMLPGLNHLFQESKTGLPSEYGTIEETFSPKALTIMSDWILEQIR